MDLAAGVVAGIVAPGGTDAAAFAAGGAAAIGGGPEAPGGVESEVPKMLVSLKI